MTNHPLKALLAAGVQVTISTDDPALFDARLNDELALLVEPFELPVATIDEILLNGIRHSFLPAADKRRHEAAQRAELEMLKREHLQS